MKRYRIPHILFMVTVMLIVGLFQGVPGARGQAEKAVIEYYQQRELKAPPEIKLKLDSLREEIRTKNYTFQVGYTKAMDYTIEKITGLVEPPNLPELIRKQKEAAEKLLDQKLLKAVSAECSAAAANFDWRKVNGATGVRDQDGCGSCWAFATHGAFEGSYRIRNNLAINSSEQDTLDCNPWGYSCDGGWWAHQYLIDTGSAKELDYPYTAVKGTCKTTVTRPYKAVAWGYVGSGAGVPSVTDLKQALCQYGPLAVAVLVTQAFQAYTSGVFNACATGSVNHGVTLIGWDDAKGAWLIKNSWGTDWGETGGYGSERGYMWITYNCSSIGYAASWVQGKTAQGCL
jgi:C1A family cysteine protease